MTTAREEILARIRAALGDQPGPVEVPRDYHRPPTSTVDGPAPAEVVALFAERAADYRATVESTTPGGLPGAIAAALRARGASRLVVPAGIPPDWLAEAGVERLADLPPLTIDQLNEADGVLTGAAVAIALTGTVVLDAGPDQGRRALSLLPDYHLCVIRADQIVATVPEAVARLDPRRPQTWISGPSATSDIELNRVEGVHGPRTLHLLICA
jgi:L-lactate dehydrogenase complex protein LldG